MRPLPNVRDVRLMTSSVRACGLRRTMLLRPLWEVPPQKLAPSVDRFANGPQA